MNNYQAVRMYLPENVEKRALVLANAIIKTGLRPTPPDNAPLCHGTKRIHMPPTYKLGFLLQLLIDRYGEQALQDAHAVAVNNAKAELTNA